jgi:hypothetical protein
LSSAHLVPWCVLRAAQRYTAQLSVTSPHSPLLYSICRVNGYRARLLNSVVVEHDHQPPRGELKDHLAGGCENKPAAGRSGPGSVIVDGGLYRSGILKVSCYLVMHIHVATMYSKYLAGIYTRLEGGLAWRPTIFSSLQTARRTALEYPALWPERPIPRTFCCPPEYIAHDIIISDRAGRLPEHAYPLAPLSKVKFSWCPSPWALLFQRSMHSVLQSKAHCFACGLAIQC